MVLLRRITRSSLVSGAGIYLGAGILNAAIPFLLLPVLTRYLNPEEYGEVAVFQVWVSLIGAFCGLSVHGAAGRKYYDYDGKNSELGEFIFACLCLLALSTLAVFLAVWPMSGWVAELLGLSEFWLLIGIPFAFCNFLIQLRLGQWQVSKRAGKFGAFQISQSLSNMMLSLLLVVVFLMGVDGRLIGYFVSVLLFGVVALCLLYREGLVSWGWRPDLMKEAAEFGVPLIPHIVGAFFLLTADRAVIGAVLGLEEAGYYMVAAQLAMGLSLILDSVNKAYVPWLYERLKKNVDTENRVVVKLTYAYGVFLAACVVVAFVFGPPVLILIAGEEYRPAGELIGWLVLGQSMRGMYFMVSSYIFYAKRTWVIARITITSGVLNVALMYIFLQEFGLVGAAWAFCLSMLLQWLVTWGCAAQLIKMPWMLKVSL